MRKGSVQDALAAARREPTPLKRGYYEVVRDPDQDNGFVRGAQFPSQEIRIMLAMGYMTDGTIMRDPCGGLVTVERCAIHTIDR
jgi:hypothetical protein